MNGIGWAVADGWTIARRDLTHWVRQPAPVIVGLLFPIMLVVMFGYLFGGAMTMPGGANYREFLMPGMFALTMVFGLESTMLAVTADVTNGVTDRFKAIPMARSAVLLGRSVADMLNSVVVLGVLVATGLAVGWTPHLGFTSSAAAFGLLLLLRLAMLWIGIYLGVLLRNPETVMVVQVLVWPLGFLSNAFVSPSTMPGWLGVLAECNPLSLTVSAIRELFGNPGWHGASVVGANAGVLAVLVPVALLAVFVPLSIRRYQALGG